MSDTNAAPTTPGPRDASESLAVGPALPTLDADAHVLAPLLSFAAEAPDRPVFAVRDGAGYRDISSAEFSGSVHRVAAGLLAAGVEPGDRVALMASTRLEWLLFDFAILAAGGVTVPIYDTSSAEQIQWIVSDSGAVLLVVENQTMREAAESIRGDIPGCREILVIDDDAVADLERRGAGIDDEAVGRIIAGLGADDLATVIYTSGTTGRPKGCVLSHRNLRTNVTQSGLAVGPALQPEESGMLFLPLAHVLTKGYVLFALERRMRCAFGTDVAHLAEEFPLAQPTVIAAVPRIFEKVYEGARQKAVAAGKGKIFDTAAEVAITWSQQRTAGKVSPVVGAKRWLFDKLVYAKIRAAFGGKLRFAFSGGGPLGERLTHFFAGIGLDVYEGYGLTETSPTLTINAPGVWKPGTVGRPVAGTTIRIADDGEILAKGPQVFAGYWHNDGATAEVFHDGWFRTGDVGALDADGYLRITGRKKELIVTSAGKNVAPAPLEDRLRAGALVSQAVVIGEGRPFVSALVTLDELAVERWCAERGREGATMSELVDDADLRAEIQQVVDAANASVSRAESIREFTVLPSDFTIESDELTPTLKVRRGTVEKSRAAAIDTIYSR
ncbi:MAG: AMP-dependent synthetase/ligase [Acidimicrobiales bacterium]